MPRPLPTLEEARVILARKRTRPAWRAPPPAGKSLAKFIKALDERFGQGADGLKARWREVAGETLARRTEPVKLVHSRTGAGAILEIKVDGPAAALIQHQAPQIIERANLFLGSGAVTRLRIVQGPVKAAAAQASAAATVKSRRRMKAPLDAAVEANLEDGLRAASDGPLKTALLRLGREVMRRA